jgi:hypothetical protein
MKRGWIVGGWLVAMIASVLPALWSAMDLASRNPLGIYADPISGAPTLRLYLQFLKWWLPIAIPISGLAAACMVLNRPSD